MRIKLLKSVDHLLGRLLAEGVPGPAVTSVLPAAIHRLLLIRPGGIGDAVLLAPAIIRLKKDYPDATITVLAEKRNAGVFSLVPCVDRVCCYDRPSEFLAALSASYDAVIDTEQWHRLSAVVARLVRAPVKIGFGTNERSRMFTHAIDYSHDDYEAASFSRLLAPLGGDRGACAAPFLTVADEVRAASGGLLAPLAGRPYLVIFPGASIPERRWGIERFQQVAWELNRRGYGVVTVGGREDETAAAQIVAGFGLNLAGRTSLKETAAVLKGSQLLISGDSGVLHIAVGLGVPTVSLFGPGRALKWAPRGEGHVVINKNLACSPCTTFGTTPPCPYGVPCMGEITVDEVLRAVQMLMEGAGGGSRDRLPGGS